MGSAWLALAGCVATGGAPVPADLTAGLVAAAGDQPPDEPEGACWARDTTPAVIETEMRQEMVAPARVAADGTTVPATFRSVTQQKIVQDRRDVWFQTPCPEALTVGFVASLQRALKARGLYRARSRDDGCGDAGPCGPIRPSAGSTAPNCRWRRGARSGDRCGGCLGALAHEKGRRGGALSQDPRGALSTSRPTARQSAGHRRGAPEAAATCGRRRGPR